MGCFEKCLGSLLGLFFVVVGIWGMAKGAYETAQGVFFIISGGVFTLLNLFTSFEFFQSFWESIFQSAFMGVIGKWAVLAAISFGIGFGLCAMFFGFDFLRL